MYSHETGSALGKGALFARRAGEIGVAVARLRLPGKGGEDVPFGLRSMQRHDLLLRYPVLTGG